MHELTTHLRASLPLSHRCRNRVGCDPHRFLTAWAAHVFGPHGIFNLLHLRPELLWPPYEIGQAIIFPSCGFFLSSSFFPRLISAAAHWMSTILRHMVWPSCKFRMQVSNVLRAARWKCRTQKIAKSRHMGTIAQFCRPMFSQLRHVSTIGKKLVQQ